MRYFFISDIHGCYDKLMLALNHEDFNASEDTLVTLGDCFDRGPQSKEVLEYVMGLPHHICIMGNHEERLMTLLRTHQKDIYDNHNGLRETFQSLCGLEKCPKIFWGLQLLVSDGMLRPTYNLLWKYLDSCYYAIEFKDFVGVHGWLPYENIYGGGYDVGHSRTYKPMPNWRTEATKEDWYNAMWCDSLQLMQSISPDKNLIIGHYWADRIATACGEKRVYEDEKQFNAVDNVWEPFINCSVYNYKNGDINITCIDGASNYWSGEVNVVVYETDEIPTVYRVINGKTCGISLNEGV